MKRPYKTIALFIFAACVVYAAWPKETVKGHNPATGGGIPSGHSPDDGHGHGHLEPAPLVSPVEEAPLPPEEGSGEE